jgi:hypothetical protein
VLAACDVQRPDKIDELGCDLATGKHKGDRNRLNLFALVTLILYIGDPLIRSS